MPSSQDALRGLSRYLYGHELRNERGVRVRTGDTPRQVRFIQTAARSHDDDIECRHETGRGRGGGSTRTGMLSDARLFK